MIIVLKILAMGCCGVICYQDFRERAVLWFLFPILGLLLGTLHYLQLSPSYFLLSIGFNLATVSLVLLVLYLYVKHIAKKKFLNHSLGLGDILFFFALAMGFPSVTFIILFVISLLFSLLVFILLKAKMSIKTVPLAGLMGLFLGFVLACSLCFDNPSLYFS